MDNNITEARENILAGAVGAFLFSLAGGILWFLLYQLGYLAAISGIIGVICAVKGYTFFTKTKKESKACLIISIAIAVLVLAASWYLCVGYDIFLAYQDWFATGEIDFTLTFFESVRAIPIFFEDSEIRNAYVTDLAIGLVFAAVGAISYLASREKKMKRLAAEEAASFTIQTAPETTVTETKTESSDT